MRNMLSAATVLVAASLGLAHGATADTILFDNPAGTIASPYTYGDGVIAYGFIANNNKFSADEFSRDNSSRWVSNSLFGKADGAGEDGVGLAGTYDHEINAPMGRQAIVLNLSSLIGRDVQIQLNSVQDGEVGQVSLGTGLLRTDFSSFTAIGSDSTLLDLGTISSADAYAAVEASDGNVLIHALTTTSASIPEPASLGLLGLGLLGLGFVTRKRRS